MVIVESADLVIGFWDGESPGTKDSIKKAEHLGKTIITVSYKDEMVTEGV